MTRRFSPGRMVGLVALAAIVCSVVSISWSAYRKNRERHFYYAAMAKARVLTIGCVLYAEDHKGKFPEASQWEEAIKPYVDTKDMAGTLRVDGAFEGRAGRFAMNKALSGRNPFAGSVSDYKAANTILLFVTDSDAVNAQGVPPPYRQDGTANVMGFADGHISSYQHPMMALPH